jgi:hypothetical protein
MITFIETLKMRSEPLFWFGVIFLICALVCAVFMSFTHNQVLGVNAYLKPLKFFASSQVLSWTLAWYIGYLPPRPDVAIATWIIIGVLCFQDAYIFAQAARVELSHFNVSTPFHTMMFGLMATTASTLTLAVLYIGLLFWRSSFPDLPGYYVWAIRLGMVIFVVFSFQGFAMGARLAHTVGAPDGGEGLPLLNWSRRFGDLRVAHFVGMHALQVLPLLAWYVLRSTKATFAVSALYLALAAFTWVQALQGRPLLSQNKALNTPIHHNEKNQNP